MIGKRTHSSLLRTEKTMIIQMITGNQSKAVNDMKSQSQHNFFHEGHGTTAGILLQNDCNGDVTVSQGKRLPAKSD